MFYGTANGNRISLEKPFAIFPSNPDTLALDAIHRFHKRIAEDMPEDHMNYDPY